jgi:Family of unknown function (DUF6065)
MADDPELCARYSAWADARNQRFADKPKIDAAAWNKYWEKDYLHGRNANGSKAPPDHRTRLKLKPF